MIPATCCFHGAGASNEPPFLRTGRGNGNKDGRQDDDLIYVNLSIPFGGSQHVSSYMRKQGNRNSYGVQNSGALSPGFLLLYLRRSGQGRE